MTFKNQSIKHRDLSLSIASIGLRCIWKSYQNYSMSLLSEGTREMLEEDHRVMFLKFFEQPFLLFDGHVLVQ